MAVEVAKDVAQLRSAVAAARRQGKTVGLVPTMGALHDGHAHLLRWARREGGFVVASIFVNPKQFGPNEDLTRYPRTWDEDIALCQAEGVDLVFAPAAGDVYPPNYRTYVEVEGLQDVLCGESRPGHFRGVATVVLKLFNMVQPDFAYFGWKDAQQARIIAQMIYDLNLPIVLRGVETVREPDGLALSSRNRYLSPADRQSATCLCRALVTAFEVVGAGERDAEKVRREMRRIIEAAPNAVIDYVAVVDLKTLQSVDVIHGGVRALVAVKFGVTRLIDNLLLHPPEGRGSDA